MLCAQSLMLIFLRVKSRTSVPQNTSPPHHHHRCCNAAVPAHGLSTPCQYLLCVPELQLTWALLESRGRVDNDVQESIETWGFIICTKTQGILLHSQWSQEWEWWDWYYTEGELSPRMAGASNNHFSNPRDCSPTGTCNTFLALGGFYSDSSRISKTAWKKFKGEKVNYRG